MSKKLSHIKERVDYFAETQEITKREFFRKIGMSWESFRGSAMKTNLNSEAIGNLLSLHPEINPYWLILGEGEMLVSAEKSEENEIEGQRDSLIQAYREMIEDKNTIIKLLKEENARLKSVTKELYENQKT